jgi:UDP-N-acetylmuramyl pentapeptide phosphotransferase/UDP-N-acetylglucosamine-1-phosphate transferase
LTAFACGFFIFLNHSLSIGQDKSVGVQKFHLLPTSRLGGLALFCGLIACDILMRNYKIQGLHLFETLLICSLPIFFGGLIEDLTHRVSAFMRLILAVLSSTLVWFLLDLGVHKTDVFFIDFFLQWPLISFLTTLLVVAGFSHSINIIDGFNGLASGQVLIMIAFLAYLNYTHLEQDLFFISLLLASALVAFFFWNWPLGKIFLGDSGAYLLGFFVVCIGLLLLQRRPEISPFAPILIGLAPLIEALFSIYRRALIKKQSIIKPDALHLHSLMYRRIVVFIPSLSKFSKPILNSFVGPFFWLTSFLFSLISTLFCENKFALFFLFFTYIILYIWLFKSIVSLKNLTALFSKRFIKNQMRLR